MLKNSQHLISDSIVNYDFDDKTIPEKILKLLINSNDPKESFIIFGKGVKI